MSGDRDNSMGEEEIDRWIRDLRKRTHDLGNALMRIEGLATSTQMMVEKVVSPRLDDHHQLYTELRAVMKENQDNTQRAIDSIRESVGLLSTNMVREVAEVRLAVTRVDVKQLCAFAVVSFVLSGLSAYLISSLA